MKRFDALQKAQRAVNAEYPRRQMMIGDVPITSGPLETVAILEGLGLIKFDEPEKEALSRIAVRRGALDSTVSCYRPEEAERPIELGGVRADQIIEGLKAAGFRITRCA